MYSLCHRMKEIPNDKVEEQTAVQQMEQADVNEFPQNNISMAQIKNAASLLTLSMYSRQCLDEILNEVSLKLF